MWAADDVSIHAPTWGATSGGVPSAISIVFQSTRPRGARHARNGCEPEGGVFQSTRPRGARPAGRRLSAVAAGVSIHAPTWGATRARRISIRCSMFQSTRPRGARPQPAADGVHRDRFQSTRPRGARHVGVECAHRLCVFQSTRPRGARRGHLDRGRTIRRFNPRAHVGRDGAHPSRRAIGAGFNPRAHVGRDPLPNVWLGVSVEFQSTRPRGARQQLPHSAPPFMVFQSTRPRGARLTGVPSLSRRDAFQSTRPRGARRGDAELNRVSWEVSIHAPTWGATTSV